jgi:outer membrane protein
METEDGLRAAATLKKLFESRQRELDQRQNDLQKERDDIEKQKGVLSQEALQKKVDKWQGEMAEIQSTFVEYNKELQKKQGEITQPILEKAMNIIRRLATQGGYDLVLEKQMVPYHRSDLDLTDRVITMYNAGEGGDAKGAAPASGAPTGKTAPAAAAPAPAKTK